MVQKLSKAQKLGNDVNPAFTFWIENKVANKRVFFISDIRQLFQKWLRTKETDWLEYYDSTAIVSSFIADKNGLNAVGEPKEFEEIRRLLKPDILAVKK
jgi:hypothetical protein